MFEVFEDDEVNRTHLQITIRCHKLNGNSITRTNDLNSSLIGLRFDLLVFLS